jgi:hypothetical protein
MLRQEDCEFEASLLHSEFEGSLGYIHSETLSQEKTKNRLGAVAYAYDPNYLGG